MRRFFIFLSLVGLLVSANQISAAGNDLEIPVEVVEVKEIGLSDRDESKSVIEIRWHTGAIQKGQIASYNLTLSATYADGTIISERYKVEKNALSTRLEIPSVKTYGKRPSAVIRKLNARVYAVIYKN